MGSWSRPVGRVGATGALAPPQRPKRSTFLLITPSRPFTRSIFFTRSLTLVPRCLLPNRTETLHICELSQTQLIGSLQLQKGWISDPFFLQGDQGMHCSFFVWPFVFEDSLKYQLFSVAQN